MSESKAKAKKGSCLCGAIKLTAKNVNEKVGVCHCKMCQKWGGGPLLAVDCGDDVTFKNENYISTCDTSEWAERAFCKQCGSHMYYRLKKTNQFIIPVGLFDTDVAFELDHQIFIDSKPSYYCFSNKTKDLTGEEVFAQYAPAEE